MVGPELLDEENSFLAEQSRLNMKRFVLEVGETFTSM
jgi:hypothetical protein